MKKFFVSIIRLYQSTISPDTGYTQNKDLPRNPTCVFYPTCSEYTIEAIEKYGGARGLFRGIRRVLRCHPWQKNRFDPLK